MRPESLRVAAVMLLLLDEFARSGSPPRSSLQTNRHPPSVASRHHPRKSFLEDYFPGFREELRMARGRTSSTTSRNQFLLEQAALFNKLLQNVDYGCLKEQEPPSPNTPKPLQKKAKKKVNGSNNDSSPQKVSRYKNKTREILFDDVLSVSLLPSRSTEASRRSYDDEIITEKQMLDLILFISSLFLLFNVFFILGKCGCYRLGRRTKGNYLPLCSCTLCNHNKSKVRCPSCCCASVTEPCDIYCCEKCELHCKSHCTHTTIKPAPPNGFFSRLFREFSGKKVGDVATYQCPACPGESSPCSNKKIKSSIVLETPPPPVVQVQPPPKVALSIKDPGSTKGTSSSSDQPSVRSLSHFTQAPAALGTLPQCTCYDDRKDVEDKIKCLLKNAAKESSRGRIAAETALINVVNQISKFQNTRGMEEEEVEKEKRRIYCLVQKAMKDIKNFKSCDMWGEDIIIDQTIHKIMNMCSCSLVSPSTTNRQFLQDLLHKAAYNYTHQYGNTESILESTVDEIIKRRLIKEAPSDFCDPSTTEAPPEVRLRTYLKYQVAIVLCAEPHQRDHIIKKAYHNILKDEQWDSESAQRCSSSTDSPKHPVKIDPTGAKWLHLTATEPQDERPYNSTDSSELEMSKSISLQPTRPK